MTPHVNLLTKRATVLDRQEEADMTELSVVHDTIVVEQTFSAAPERVFQAWADPKQRAQWHFPGDAVALT
jgi:hypothetical protein